MSKVRTPSLCLAAWFSSWIQYVGATSALGLRPDLWIATSASAVFSGPAVRAAAITSAISASTSLPATSALSASVSATASARAWMSAALINPSLSSARNRSRRSAGVALSPLAFSAASAFVLACVSANAATVRCAGLVSTLPSASMKHSDGKPPKPFSWSSLGYGSSSTREVLCRKRTTSLANFGNSGSESGPLSSASHGPQPA